MEVKLNNIKFQKGDVIEILEIQNLKEKHLIEILINNKISGDILLENNRIKSIRIGFEIFKFRS